MKVEEKESLTEIFDDQQVFSSKTFGSGIVPQNSINHLKREVEELIQEPYDHEEYADCLLLLMDAFWRAGGTAIELLEATRSKLEKNKKRKWGKPDSEGVIEHISENSTK